MAAHDDLAHRFKFHPADTEQRKETHALVRGAIAEVANLVQVAVPAGREQALAITKLEEAMFWANAGIARAPE